MGFFFSFSYIKLDRWRVLLIFFHLHMKRPVFKLTTLNYAYSKRRTIDLESNIWNLERRETSQLLGQQVKSDHFLNLLCSHSSFFLLILSVYISASLSLLSGNMWALHLITEMSRGEGSCWTSNIFYDLLSTKRTGNEMS